MDVRFGSYNPAFRLYATLYTWMHMCIEYEEQYRLVYDSA
jgi:hypothetical protein